jgi:hypothetical protein
MRSRDEYMAGAAAGAEVRQDGEEWTLVWSPSGKAHA